MCLGCSGDIILKEITPFIANDLKELFLFETNKVQKYKSRSKLKF